MDFAGYNSYIFEPGQYDSASQPIINFNDMDEYPKFHSVTQSPINSGYVVMDREDIHRLSKIKEKEKLKDGPKTTIVKKQPIKESLTDFMDYTSMKWLLFVLVLTLITSLIQIFNSYTNNLVLASLISLQTNKIKAEL